MLAAMGTLFCLFLACLVGALRRNSARVLVALALTGLLVGFVLPEAALRGLNPLMIAAPTGIVVALVGALLVGGWNRKALAAGIGASVAICLAAGLPWLLGSLVQLSGLDPHFGPRPHLEIRFWYDPAFGRVDFGNLQLAVIVLASMGAVTDVAMVIASSVHEANRGGLSLSGRGRTGLRAGREVLGPMLATMLLVFCGAELVGAVARAGVAGGGDALCLLDFETFAAHALEFLTAAAGMLAVVPATAFLAARMLGENDTRQDAHGPLPRGPFPRRGELLVEIGWRAAACVTVLLGALALERGYIRRLDSAHVQIDTARNTRQQEVAARVIAVRPPIELAADPGIPHNPVRGPAGDKLVPCAARVLSGEQRGRVVTFLNRIEPRPYVNVLLRRGSLARLSLTTRAGHVVDAQVYPPPLRRRPLLWSAAVLMAFLVLVFGRHGVRAILLTASVAVALVFVVAPLLAQGVSPPLVVLAGLGALVLALLLFWGVGWRPILIAGGGASLGLLVGGMLSFGTVWLAGIDGTASATYRLLLQRPAMAAMDFPQLLAAAMTVMVMGAALDVAASVTVGLTEFRAANEDASRSEALAAGLRLNRDVAGMMVLTVLFAWIALRVPVWLLMRRSADAFGSDWMECLVMDMVPVLTGAIAILLAGSFATVLFARAYRRGDRRVVAKEANGVQRPWLILVVAITATALAGGWMAMVHRPLPAAQLPVRRLQDEKELPALWEWAERRAREGDWDGCMIVLWRMQDLGADDPQITRDLAYAYLARNWREAASEVLRPALRALQGDARTHYILGVLAMWEGDVETARQELQRAIQLAPSSSYAIEALSRLP